MMLEADIIDRLRADFDSADSRTAIDELSASRSRGRVARCVVVAAGGSLDRLRTLIRMADTDYRDVIVAGEYDHAMRCVRDLRVSFLIGTPGDFWVGEVAVAVDKHGYRLTKLISHPATIGPFDYTSDRSEGSATFSNGIRAITVQKQDRQWLLAQIEPKLCSFGLDAVFHDEKRFLIQLDCYLSRT